MPGETFEDKEFGANYVLRQVAADVREIRSQLQAFATKAEVAYIAAKVEDFVPKAEIESKFKERDERNDKRFEEIKQLLTDVNAKMATKEEAAQIKERMDQGPIAQWFFPTVLGFVQIGTLVYAFMHGGAK